MDIKDKVIIITGASEGIGEAAARLLVKKGAKVIISSRSIDKLKKLEKQLPGSYAIAADMRIPDEIRNLVEKTIHKFGRVDILINNAGQGMYGPLEFIKIDEMKQIMELNLYGVIRAMQAVIPIMRKQGGGMIVNISSGVSKRYIPGISAYSSTKYALNAISNISRQELEKDKIIVSTVFPRITSTRFAENSFGNRPDFSATGRPMPAIDPPELVAEKIVEIIETEKDEIVM